MDDHFYIKVGHFNIPALALAPWERQSQFLFHRKIQYRAVLFLFIYLDIKII